MNSVSKKLIHPASLMLGFWVLLYALYWLAPLVYKPPISMNGTLFIVSHLAVFSMGSLLTGGLLQKKVPADLSSTGKTTFCIEKMILMLFCLSMLGFLLCIADKMLKFETFSLIKLAGFRSIRAQELLYVKPLNSTVFSGLGFLLYPAGFLASFLCMLFSEMTVRRTHLLFLCYILLLFAYSLVNGNRSAIYVVMLFSVIAGYLRYRQNKSIVPKSWLMKISLILLYVGFFRYSSLVWKVRSTLSGQDMYAFLAHADAVWGVAPSAGLEAFAARMGCPSMVQHVLGNIFYYTQSLSVLEKILAMDHSPVLWGAYHIDLMAALIRKFLSNPDFLAQGYAALLAQNIYGFFAGAWGALYIDFGLIGSYIAALLWGFLMGCAYRSACHTHPMDGLVRYGFWMYTILVSFVSPPFGFANSAVTFLWFMVYRIMHSTILEKRLPVFISQHNLVKS